MMSNPENKPSNADYIAGALFTNGLVGIWYLIISRFSDLFSRIPTIFLVDITLLIYILSGAIAAYQVCKKTSVNQTLVGLKLALLTWGLYILLIPTLISEISSGEAVIFLFCFIAGGLSGAYLAIKSKLRKLKVTIEN